LAIVSTRYWTESGFQSYVEGIVLLVEHYLSRLVVVEGLLRTIAPDFAAKSRHLTLNFLLNVRTILTWIEQALATRETIEQGFTRNLAREVGREPDLPGLVQLLEKRCANLLQRVELEDAISSARKSTSLSIQNIILQTTALLVALVALTVSILLR
jgi:hypothetical protein